jgi:group I intron endonuclease
MDNQQRSLLSEERSQTIPSGSTLQNEGEKVGITYIYCLKDPNTLEIRYIGKSNNPNKRFIQHKIDSKNYKIKFYKNNWINQLLNIGLEPILEILEQVSINNWKEREIYWIAYYKNLGFKLTNLTNGGDGNNNQVRTKETNLKISLALKGKKRSQEVKDKISKSNKNKIISLSTREKLRQANLGKKASEHSKLLKSKIVYQYNKQGELINKYCSLTEAANKLNCRKSSISNSIIRKGTYRGFVFSYE